MAVSKAQQKAVNKYVKSNYDRIELVVKPKGRKEEIKAHASTMGETLNSFITRAIKETMERDGSGHSPTLEDSQMQNSVPQIEPQPVPEETGLPSYLTPDILAHIDRDKFAHDIAYQIEIGNLIGMAHIADLAEYLKQ